MTSPSPPPSSYHPFIVGVGASAGGLDALRGLLSTLPDELGAAIVVVQHLSPDHPSLLDEILAKQTAFPVRVAEEGMDVEVDHVYLIPPGKNLLCDGLTLHLVDPPARDRGVPNRSIDALFESLAESAGSRTLAVILSGTGTDGTLGAASVVARGGQVLVQSPGSAAFDGMPRSAIEAGVADAVGTPEQLAERVVAHLASPQRRLESDEVFAAEEEERIQEIFRLLHAEHGVDFKVYKPSTVLRRLRRRVSLRGLETLAEYVECLDDPDELGALFEDLLIDVTAFFRDPLAWEGLRRLVVDPWIDKDRDKERRAWVCACSTGEEAYTLAMVVAEAYGVPPGGQPPIRIFASDVSRRSLERAAAALYRPEALELVSPARKERFFERVDSMYRVKPEIRRAVVFVSHDVTHQTPFNRMDLVSCRNVLIYMRPEQQRRVINVFHYALWPGGALFLGSAEGVLTLSDRFSELDAPGRLFRVIGRGRPTYQDPLPRGPHGVGGLAPPPSPRRERRGGTDSLMAAALTAQLSAQGASGVVVSRTNDLMHVLGEAPEFLRPPSGVVSFDVTRMLPDALALAVRSGLYRARTERGRAVVHGVRYAARGAEAALDVHALPLGPTEEGVEADLLVFVPTQTADAPSPGAHADLDELALDRVQRLESELAKSREHLQSVVEELEATNEEQQAANEELLSTNEELQSANEEMGSLNEELHTVNAEYKAKIQELLDLNADMSNLLDGLDVGVVFLDDEGRVLRFNRAATAVFRLTIVDVGRPLDHLADSLVDRADRERLFAALAEPGAWSQVLATEEGTWRATVLPVSDGDGGTRSLLTLVDISELALARGEVARQAALLEVLAARLPDVLWVIGADGSYQYISDAYEAMWGITKEELQAHPERFAQLLHPDDRARVTETLADGLAHDGFDMSYRIVRPDDSTRWARGRGYPWYDEHGARLGNVGVIQDVTEQRKTQLKLESYQHRLEELMSALGKVVFEIYLDEDRVVWRGPSEALLGITLEGLGASIEAFRERVHPADRGSLLSAQQAAQLRGARSTCFRLRTDFGTYVWAHSTSFMTGDEKGRSIAEGALEKIGPPDVEPNADLAMLEKTWRQLGAHEWSFDSGHDEWRLPEPMLAAVGGEAPRAHFVAHVEAALRARVHTHSPIFVPVPAGGPDGRDLSVAMFRLGAPGALEVHFAGLAVPETTGEG